MNCYLISRLQRQSALPCLSRCSAAPTKCRIEIKAPMGADRKFLEPLVRFMRGDVGPYRFIQNRSRSFVVTLKSEAVAEKSKNQLSRDF